MSASASGEAIRGESPLTRAWWWCRSWRSRRYYRRIGRVFRDGFDTGLEESRRRMAEQELVAAATEFVDAVEKCHACADPTRLNAALAVVRSNA